VLHTSGQTVPQMRSHNSKASNLLCIRGTVSVLSVDKWWRHWAHRWINHLSLMHVQCDARPMAAFPARGHCCPATGTKLYCLMTEAHVWTTCPRLLPNSQTAGNRTHDLLTCRCATRPHVGSCGNPKNVNECFCCINFWMWGKVTGACCNTILHVYLWLANYADDEMRGFGHGQESCFIVAFATLSKHADARWHNSHLPSDAGLPNCCLLHTVASNGWMISCVCDFVCVSLSVWPCFERKIAWAINTKVGADVVHGSH